LSELNLIITDQKISDEGIQPYKALGIEVIRA